MVNSPLDQLATICEKPLNSPSQIVNVIIVFAADGVLPWVDRPPRKACRMNKTLPILLCVIAAVGLIGCEHMVETRVVQRFSESLKEHDLTQLKAESSDEFDEKVVLGDDMFRALELLDVPQGKPEIKRVSNIRAEKHGKIVQKNVWVKVGRENHTMVFTLKPHKKTGRWVVDDVFLNQSDYDSKRSVASRLGVLVGVQAALDAWRSESREQIVAASTQEFGESLALLTLQQVSELAKKVTADLPEVTKILRNERVGEETADVAVAKSQAQILMAMRRDGDRWKLDDLSVKATRAEDNMGSTRLVAGALTAALQFEKAFREGDKDALRTVCTDRFYTGSLAQADLLSVRLPQSGPGLSGFDIKMQERAATIVVPADNEWLMIGLAQQPQDRLHSTPRYLVEDVSIYNGTQNKRLPALLTARNVVDAFAVALANRDLKALRNCSSFDLNSRVWDRSTAVSLENLPTSDFVMHKPQFIQTRFEGLLTEVIVQQGSGPITYRLRDDGGVLLVDDLLVPATAWSDSFKEVAEILTPLLVFRESLHNSQLEVLRGNSSAEFCRVAWNQLDAVPKFDLDVEKYFALPLTSIQRTDDGARVIYGDVSRGATIQISREKGKYVVDELVLISGRADSQQIALKQTIRSRLAQGQVSNRDDARDQELFTGDNYGSRLHR